LFLFAADKEIILIIILSQLQAIDKLPVLPIFFELIGISVAWVSIALEPQL
jgi:hypothetical protein